MLAKLKLANQKIKTVDTQVFVVTAQKGLVTERLKLCTELWAGKIRVCIQFLCIIVFNS